MSYKFDSFCVFPSILFMFTSAWYQMDPIVPSINIDNCLQNAQNAEHVKICHV